jgi:NAD(P)-dependent dehydrogenase (short-subunit alcohol dehydrogenase family)
MRLKPIEEQVVALMGASSGIGREAALRFAERGAKVVVSARSEPGLHSLRDLRAADRPRTRRLLPLLRERDPAETPLSGKGLPEPTSAVAASPNRGLRTARRRNDMARQTAKIETMWASVDGLRLHAHASRAARHRRRHIAPKPGRSTR